MSRNARSEHRGCCEARRRTGRQIDPSARPLPLQGHRPRPLAKAEGSPPPSRRCRARARHISPRPATSWCARHDRSRAVCPDPGSVGKPRLFLDRQRVHIRARPHFSTGLLRFPVDHPHDAWSANTGHKLVGPHCRKTSGKETRRAFRLEGQFGMSMKIVSLFINFRYWILKRMNTDYFFFPVGRRKSTKNTERRHECRPESDFFSGSGRAAQLGSAPARF